MAEIWVAIITNAGLVLVALIQQARSSRRLAHGLDRIKSDTMVARTQVENDHDTNLRDDVDKLTLAVTGLTREIRSWKAESMAEDVNLWTALKRITKGD